MVVPSVASGFPEKLAAFASVLAESDDDTSNMVSKKVSLRMMLRASRRTGMYPNDSYAAVNSGIMVRFMPTPARAAVAAVLRRVGLVDPVHDDIRVTAETMVRSSATYNHA